MKKLLFSLVTFLSLSAFAQDTKVINDANATQRTLHAGFTAIHVSSGIDLYITQGNEESLAVSASDQKHLDRLKTEIENGTLKIYYDNKGVTWKPGNKKLKAYVSFKTLERLHASSGSQVTVNGSINAENLDLNVSSGAGFNGAIHAKELSADVSSGAGVKISGKADKLTVDVSSGADFKGYDLAVDFCDAKASSGASLHVTINKELNAKASSGADIRYKGTALIRDIKVSAGGAVKKA
jgi:Putative auto-transporter adhesin, head GIN domain